jgi:hypothetical protein
MPLSTKTEQMFAERYASITETARKVGIGGSMARQAWGKERLVCVHNVEIKNGKMQLSLIDVTVDSFGAYAPTPEDLRAIDWYAIAYSTTTAWPVARSRL